MKNKIVATSQFLADRMKDYENISRIYLEEKLPVIIRLDGKAFHTYTRGFEKPFDEVIYCAMTYTMKKLCNNIQGCVMGYTQSDEITLVLVDYNTVKTDSFFGYNIQKIVSIASSMATVFFNGYVSEYCQQNWQTEKTQKIKDKIAFFDARCYNLPVDEVCNCLIWRQRDAIRNSILGLAQAWFSHKELLKLNTTEVKEKLLAEKSVDWENLSEGLKQGFTCLKNNEGKWEIQHSAIFQDEPNIINNLVTVGLWKNKLEIGDRVLVRGNQNNIGSIVDIKQEYGTWYYSVDVMNESENGDVIYFSEFQLKKLDK